MERFKAYRRRIKEMHQDSELEFKSERSKIIQDMDSYDVLQCFLTKNNYRLFIGFALEKLDHHPRDDDFDKNFLHGEILESEEQRLLIQKAGKRWPEFASELALKTKSLDRNIEFVEMSALKEWFSEFLEEPFNSVYLNADPKYNSHIDIIDTLKSIESLVYNEGAIEEYAERVELSKDLIKKELVVKEKKRILDNRIEKSINKKISNLKKAKEVYYSSLAFVEYIKNYVEELGFHAEVDDGIDERSKLTKKVTSKINDGIEVVVSAAEDIYPTITIKKHFEDLYEQLPSYIANFFNIRRHLFFERNNDDPFSIEEHIFRYEILVYTNHEYEMKAYLDGFKILLETLENKHVQKSFQLYNDVNCQKVELEKRIAEKDGFFIKIIEENSKSVEAKS